MRRVVAAHAIKAKMAVRRETMPDGSGREAVRGMSASMLRSSISLEVSH